MKTKCFLRQVPIWVTGFLMAFLTLTGCGNNMPRAEKGVIDLSIWDFEQDRSLALNGEWEFYWNKTIHPGDFDKEENIRIREYIRVPGSWMYYNLVKHGKFAIEGHATYRLRILGKNFPGNLSLFTEYISASFEIFVNGESVNRLKKKDKEDHSHLDLSGPYRYSKVDLDETNENEIIIHVFNEKDIRYYYCGGLITAVYLDHYYKLVNRTFFKHFLILIYGGFCLALFLYLFLTYLQRKRDRAGLFLGLCALLIGITYIWTYFPIEIFIFEKGFLNFNIYTKLQYCIIPPLISVFFLLFLHYLYPNEYKKKQVRAIVFLYCLSIILSLLLPASFSYILGWNFFFLLVIISIIYKISWQLSAVKRKRAFALPVFICMLFLLFCAFCDLLVITIKQSIIAESLGLLAPGILAVIFTNTVILARIFKRTQEEALDLAQTLKAERDSLEVRVQKRTAELKEANLKLQELDKQKTNYFADVSHELRTPLTLIRSPVEGILKGIYGKSLSVQHPVFRLIFRNCAKLLRNINNLLHFTSLELNLKQAKKEMVNFNKLIRFFCSELDSLAKSNGLVIEFQDRIVGIAAVTLDIHLFETAFFNLISNAFKFTGQGGKITIVLSEDKKGDNDKDRENDSNKETAVNGVIRLSIRDTGIGIPGDKLQVIFDRFRQARQKGFQKYEGTGIGLTITKEIIQLHHGKIEVESKVNEGSCFAIHLPCVKIKEMIKQKPLASERAAPGHEEMNWQDGMGEEELISQFPIKRELLVDLEPAGFSYGDKRAAEDIKTTEEQDPAGPEGFILIVENNKDMVEFLRAILIKDYQLDYAYSGPEALEKLQSIPKPDLIISDVMMPQMDGHAFFHAVQANRAHQDIPFIFLTARTTPEERVKSLSRGAIDYIYKPFFIDEVKARIKTVITNCKKVREADKIAIKKRLIQVIEHDPYGTDPGGKAGNYINCELLADRFDFTKREREVFSLLMLGKENKEIAGELDISLSTAKRFIYSIFSKMGVGNRLEFSRKLYTQHI